MFNYYFDSDRDGHADTVRLFEKIRTGNFEIICTAKEVLDDDN